MNKKLLVAAAALSAAGTWAQAPATTSTPAPGGVQGQLYNLADDPHELYNLWAQRPEIVARLTKLLEQYKDSGHTRY